MAVASRARSRPTLGALPSPSVVRGAVEELYDYDALRALIVPTLLIVRTSVPTFVLGGSQPLDVLREDHRGLVVVRRRRGGGGIVLLQPEDVWIDWWMPMSDERWSPDVHVSSVSAGERWRQVLVARLDREVTLHEGGLAGDPKWHVACFAARGPGEVFVDDRKVVGVTQWRVREGVFVSTVLHAHSSSPLLDLLTNVPAGLAEALEHHTLYSLGLDGHDIASALVDRSQPVDVRQVFLTL